MQPAHIEGATIADYTTAKPIAFTHLRSPFNNCFLSVLEYASKAKKPARSRQLQAGNQLIIIFRWPSLTAIRKYTR